jgi:hypothetical protein
MGRGRELAEDSHLHIVCQRLRNARIPQENQTSAEFVHEAEHHEQKVDKLEVLTQLTNLF